METQSLLLVWSFLLLCFTEFSSGDLCVVSGTYYYATKWCDHGCCGDSCCDGLAAWVIALIVIGSLIGICIIVVVICACIKTGGQSGRVVHPHPQPHVMVVGQSGSTYAPPPGAYAPPPGAYAPPPGAYAPPPAAYGPPPAYSTNAHPPPGPAAYGNNPSNPAYPPPAQQANPPSGNDPFATAAGST